MNILTIALKDLKQIARDRLSLIFLLLMPLGFTFLMGLMFGGTNEGDYRLPVGVINHDPQGDFSKVLIDSINGSDTIRLVPLDNETVIGDQIASGKLAAAITIPVSYSQKALEGTAIQLEIIANSLSTSGQTAIHELNLFITQLSGAVQTGRISLEEARLLHEVDDEPAYVLDGAKRMLAAWQDPPLSLSLMPASSQANSQGFSGFVQTSPGMLVQFTIAGLTGAVVVIVHERKNRTLSRLLSAPVRKSEVMLGHLIGVTLTVLLQELILILAGQFLFKVNYLQAPLAIFLMALAMALFCGSLGLFFGAISRRDEHAIMFPLLAMFVLTAMGGAWFPLQGTSTTFYTIGHLLPTAWAMDGFQNIILRGLGFSSVLLPALIIFGYAVLFFVLAVWRMRWE